MPCLDWLFLSPGSQSTFPLLFSVSELISRVHVVFVLGSHPCLGKRLFRCLSREGGMDGRFLRLPTQNPIFESYNLMDKLAEFELWSQKPLSSSLVYPVLSLLEGDKWSFWLLTLSLKSLLEMFGIFSCGASSVPCCPTAIRSPKDSLFCQVLGYSQSDHMSFDPRSILMLPHELCFCKASCLDIELPELVLWSFSLLLFSSLPFESLNRLQLFLPALLFRFYFIWQSSCLCLFSISYRCAPPHPAIFLFWEVFLRLGL